MINESEKLTRWYAEHARRLPWRENCDPYQIWVSEVMLQQTQVVTVIPYYHAFLADFPNLEALATAPEQAVLARWAGLGYYSRARNLQRGARYIRDKFDGKFPKTRNEILEVPGIGPYTAGAILSIAFDLPVPIVDGNVQRVFARFYGEARALELKAVQNFFWEKAEEWVARANSPRHLNQALMELGATLCTKASPRCERCPIRENCVARKTGQQGALPQKKRRAETKNLAWLGILYRRGEKIWLKQNAAGDWWADMWDIPRIPIADSDDLPNALSSHLEGRHNQRATKKITALPAQKHTVTHHRIVLYPYLVEVEEIPSELVGEGNWFEKNSRENLPVSSLLRKVLREHDVLE